MNPEEFSIPSRRVFLKRSAYSAVATSFAYSTTSILTSCQTPSNVYIGVNTPLGSAVVAWSGGSSQNGLRAQEVPGGAMIYNTTDQPIPITGLPGGPVVIPPGGAHFVAEQN
jgi:hypothetical protein